MSDSPKKRRGGNPPVEHRFQPTKSGNPGGRPKGQSVRTLLRQELARDTTIVIGGRRETVSTAEALIRAYLASLIKKPDGVLRLFGYLEPSGPEPVEVDFSLSEQEMGLLEEYIERQRSAPSTTFEDGGDDD